MFGVRHLSSHLVSEHWIFSRLLTSRQTTPLQRYNNVILTSKQRYNATTTLFQRPNNVILTSQQRYFNVPTTLF